MGAIEKKYVLITGAGKGIGLELTKSFLADGNFHVIAVTRNIAQLHTIQTSSLTIVQGDLVIEYESIIQKILDLNISIQVLVNNAAIVLNKSLASVSDEDLALVMETNFTVPYKLIRDLISTYRPGSHIVNISSMSGFQGSKKFEGLSLYSSSKAALACLSECVAVELKDSGVFCNCLALGAVDTDMIKVSIPGLKPGFTAPEMANHIYHFCLTGLLKYNGQVLPITRSDDGTHS